MLEDVRDRLHGLSPGTVVPPFGCEATWSCIVQDRKHRPKSGHVRATRDVRFGLVIRSPHRRHSGALPEPECLSGLEIDHELKLCWLHHRHVGRLGAFEDLSGVYAYLAIRLQKAR